MDSQTPRYKRDTVSRLPHKVPKGLIDNIHDKCDTHLPRPKRRTFLELVITMGLDAYEAFTAPTAPNIGSNEEMDLFRHYINADLVDRFNTLYDSKTEAQPLVRSFFEYILNLGVQAYEREYTIYGFKRD